MRNTLLTKLVSVAAAATLALSVAPAAAFADSLDTDGYVTIASGCGPNTATAEILGLCNFEENATFFADYTNLPDSLFTWSTPRYMMWGTTEYNENPNPFYYNTLYDYNGTSQKMIYNTDGRAGVEGFTGGPDTPLGKYGSGSSVVDQIWERQPDMVLGSGGGRVDYAADGYAPDIAGYSPVTVRFNGGDFGDSINEYWTAAQQANEIAAQTGKQLRYGDSTNAAYNIERLVRGTQGYILQQLAAEGKEKKTIASISGIASDGVYNLASYQDKTGQMRYLETVANVSNNIMDEVGGTVTVDQLYDVDLIILGGLSSTNTDQEILDSLPAELRDKCYYVDSGQGKTQGVTYILTTRSPENFNNINRILGCLYPEYVDQSQWLAYTLDDIYHIKDGKIAEVIDKTMDGLRNWNATGDTATDWTEADAADYNHDAVVAKLNSGIDYLMSLGAGAPATLQLTDNFVQKHAAEPSGPTFSDVATGDWFYNAVEFVVDEGLMSGYAGTDQFGPWNNLTRAETAAVMFNYAKAGGESPSAATDRNTTGLADLDATGWYTEVCNWAVAEGVMGNDPAGFRPNDTITMEELLAVISNVTGADTASADTSVLASYPDGSSVSEWATHVVAWGVQVGLVGNGDALDPTVDIYRGRVAGILYNAISNGVM